MKTLMLTLLFLVLGSAEHLSAQPTGKEPSPQNRMIKFLEWSAVEPDSRTVRNSLQKFSQMPFDGFVWRATTRTGDQMMWQAWGDRAYKMEEFQHVLEDFQSIPSTSVTERFLRMNVHPGDVNWQDEDAWRIVCENFRIAAQLIDKTKSTGLLFDTEQYHRRPFDREEVLQHWPMDSARLDNLVFQRGQEWMRAVNEACPEITILLTFSYRAGKRSEEQFFRVGNYELLIPFLDGALSVCTPETRFIDGWEYAYGYTKPHQFARANRIIKQDIPFWTADRSRYRQHFEAALGLWTDYEFRDFGWNQTDFSGNFHQPDQLTARLGQAASQVDQYVWLYSSKANWWTGENLPEAYIEAVRRAKRKVTSAGDLP